MNYNAVTILIGIAVTILVGGLIGILGTAAGLPSDIISLLAFISGAFIAMELVDRRGFK